MIESLRDLSAELIEMNPNIPTKSRAIKGIDRLGFLVNFIGSNMQVEVEDGKAFSKKLASMLEPKSWNFCTRKSKCSR